MDRRALQRQERLEAELAGYKTNLIKESIRMGHADLGDFFYHRGDLSVSEGCAMCSSRACRPGGLVLLKGRPVNE